MYRDYIRISRPAVLAFLLFLLIGFFSFPGLSQESITVGVIGPFTGPNKRVGSEIWRSYKMAFSETDNQIGDYEIELIKIDSRSDPERATQNYSRAVTRNDVDVTSFNWHSSVSVALMDLAAKYEVPHFFGGAATQVILDKYKQDPDKYRFYDTGKFWPTPKKLTPAYVSTINKALEEGKWDPDTRKVAIYGEDTDWGRNFGDAIAGQFGSEGWDVVSKDYFEMQKTTFYPLLEKWKEEDVSIIAGTSTVPTSFSTLIEKVRICGLEALVIADGLGWMGQWYELTGRSSDYVLDQIPQWEGEEAKEFRERYEVRWGYEPSAASAGLAYDGANFLIKILHETLQLHGELTSEKIQDVNHTSVRTGNLTYDEGIIMKEYKFTTDTVPDPKVGEGFFVFPVIQYQEGESTVIWPEGQAEGEISFPPLLEE